MVFRHKSTNLVLVIRCRYRRQIRCRRRQRMIVRIKIPIRQPFHEFNSQLTMKRKRSRCKYIRFRASRAKGRKEKNMPVNLFLALRRRIIRFAAGARPTLNRTLAQALRANLNRPSRCSTDCDPFIHHCVDPDSPPALKLHLVRDIRWFVRTSDVYRKGRKKVWRKGEKKHLMKF